LRTFSPKVSEIQRAWYVVDADGLVLGRLASEVARILRGKHRPYFAPHVDTGDHVVVVNADKVILTSGKADDKMAYSHSGYPGGLRSTSYAELLNVYAGPDHPHAAQRPEPLELPAARRAS
jgi:large subunit ribosomal protein L13